MRREQQIPLDPREAPAYSLSEAAHYLDIPRATLRAWCMGQRYERRGNEAWFRPVLQIADSQRGVLSFFNLTEAHVLDALRRRHEVSLQKVRRALSFVVKTMPSRHPLADAQFETDGLQLFVREYGRLIEISSEGQVALGQVLATYLNRVERDSVGDPVRLYPFTRNREASEPRAVVIDPRVAFGRPVLSGTGIPTAVIAARLKAGETIQELASDYGREPIEIEEAIRCELKAA
jgi:uncharacterized protein (DUF433 family)